MQYQTRHTILVFCTLHCAYWKFHNSVHTGLILTSQTAVEACSRALPVSRQYNYSVERKDDLYM